MASTGHDRNRPDAPATRLHEVPAEEFVDLGKSLFDLAQNGWDDASWTVTAWCRNKNENRSWKFVAEDRNSFDSRFGDVVKAICVYKVRVSGNAPGSVSHGLRAIRFLYEALRGPSGRFPLDFAWSGLTLQDWQRAEEHLGRAISPVSRYQYAGELQRIAALLEARDVIPTTRYKHSQPPPANRGMHILRNRQAAMKKLPPEGALHALADASLRPEDDRDRLLFAIGKLLVALGFRINEALTLPVDCWRTDGAGRPYLVYWPEKKGVISPKWIPTAAMDLVDGAVKTIRELTEDARRRARVLEADTTRVPLLVRHPSSRLLSKTDLAAAIGVRRHVVVDLIRRLGVAPCGEASGTGGGFLYRADEFERALAKTLPEHRYAFVRPDGKTQPLSRFLCVVPKRFFSGDTGLLTVRPVRIGDVAAFVRSGDPSQRPSVFERFGFTDENGKPWTIATHQFRHWLNTVAHKGGISDMELARWMGRKDPRQNRHYQHLDTEERVERLKEAVRSGEVVGSVSEVYRRLSADEREEFLDAEIEAVHVTPFGTCTHNFAVKPCPYHVQCLNGCGSFLRTRGDAREIVAIQGVKRRAERVLEGAEKAAEDGLPEAANWVEHNRRLLEGAERALAVDAEARGTPSGEKVRVFPKASSKGDEQPGSTSARARQ